MLGRVIRSEVLIVGGGQAGAAAAIALAKLGRDVVLCEGARFPRPHVGICLGPGVQKQLAFLGLGNRLERPEHSSELPVERRWEDGEFRVAEHYRVTIVDRGIFDADLLEAARARHVRLLQPARVVSLSRRSEGWRAVAATPNEEIALEAAFLVLASGRGAAVRRRRLGAPTLAISGHWAGPEPRRVRIGAEPHGWCWSAPMVSWTTLCVAFVGPHELKDMRGHLRERYVEMALASGVVHGELVLREVPTVCDASAYAAVGEESRTLFVGDADVALEPLSSSGVQAAIQSGLAAGPVVTTLLTEDGDHAAARDFWSERRAR